MDEPFGALDILTRETMQKELIRIWLELRPSVLFITHSISEAVYLADRIFVMKHGNVAGTFTMELERPRASDDPMFIQSVREIEKILTDQ